MTVALVLAGAALALLGLHAAFALLTPLPRRALRVLMYHRVSAAVADRGTVRLADLDRQLAWLRARYQLVSLGAVVAHLRDGAPLPDRAVLLTFDDGTDDASALLAPLLHRHGLPAALFVVPGFAGSARPYDGAVRRFCDAEDLRAVVASGLELGLHSFEHRDLGALAPDEVAADLRRCAAWLDAARLPWQPALAYPYGAYPRKEAARLGPFLAAVRSAGVVAAFRIGNRVNALPLEAPLQIERTEIRGDESFATFAWKVRTGRLRGF